MIQEHVVEEVPQQGMIEEDTLPPCNTGVVGI